MPRCVHCGHAFAVSEGLDCPACHQDWRGDKPPEKPAHLAVLQQAAASVATGQTESGPPNNRFVSTTGSVVAPPRPKRNAPRGDSQQIGWMARLEAARAVARGAALPARPENDRPTALVRPPPKSPVQPPPLKLQPPKRKVEPARKPAHLLVAQLEADAANRRDQEKQDLAQLLYEHPSQDISKVSVDVPKPIPRKRRIPDAVIIGFLGVLVLVGLVMVWAAVDREPAPEVTVDPALQAAAEKKKRAIQLLEKGHNLAAQGSRGAAGALRAYRRALLLDPGLASAERGMAVVYAAKNDDVRAVKHYRRYLRLAPDANDAKQVRRIIRAYVRAKKKRSVAN